MHSSTFAAAASWPTDAVGSANGDIVGIDVAGGTVQPEWIDLNGHMNVAYYVLAFDLAIDALWARLGITPEYVSRTSGSTFAVEAHLTYQDELREDDPYRVTMQIIAYDQKRIHHFQRMYHATRGYLAATAEWMSLHVNLDRRRVTEWPAEIIEKLDRIADEQASGLPSSAPTELSGRIAVPNPIYSAYPELRP